MKASDNGDDENYRDFYRDYYDFDDPDDPDDEAGRQPKWAGYSLILAICGGGWLGIAWAIRQCAE